jgi:MFS family permease
MRAWHRFHRTVALVFGSLVGMMFLLTQFLQLAQGYSALESGLRVMPIALGFAVGGAAMTDRLVERFGTRAAMVSGLLIVAAAFAGMSFMDGGTPYPALAAGLVLMGIGMANLMAPATAAVMDSVPGRNAGVGSALNDTARQVGAALGIAALGSLANAVYSPNLSGLISVPAELAAAAQDSIGGASLAAATVGGPAGQTLRESANAAFFDAFGVAMLAAAAVSLVASAMVVHFMPERATLGEVETAA